MIFAENPWPGVVLCGVAALLCMFLYAANRRRKFVFLAMTAVALAPGFVLWDEFVETDSEQIEAAVFSMAMDFRQGNVDGVISWMNPTDARLRALIRTAATMVTVTSDVRITALDVQLVAGRDEATSDFRANAELDVRGVGDVGRQPTRWLLTWRKADGEWRIVDIERRHPLTGEPMAVFSKAT